MTLSILGLHLRGFVPESFTHRAKYMICLWGHTENMVQHSHMRMWNIATIVVFVLVIPAMALASHADADPLRVEAMQDGISITTPGDPGGVSVAVADLGDDGVPELIAANGLGREPRVHVLRQDGSEIGSFLAYAPTLGVGLNVVACDLDGDGHNEIVTAPQRGGGPHVRVFDRFGVPLGSGTFVYDAAFRGGVNLTCGNLFGDERAELVTLPGVGGGPHIKVWTFISNELTLKKEFFAFEKLHDKGLVGTISTEQLIIAEQKTNAPVVKTFSLSNNITLVNERTMNAKNYGIASIVIHNQEYVIADDAQLISVNLNMNGSNELVHAQARRALDEINDTRILVDLSEQRLYAYENGVLENSFLISSGKFNATPLGNHHILAKIPQVHYTWTYGTNDPRNYDLGLVPYNLRFFPHIYLHYAYWHKNFGHPMSRGCVNISLEDMKWLYDWANVGVRVDVVQ